jgi:hypothetical protein
MATVLTTVIVAMAVSVAALSWLGFRTVDELQRDFDEIHDVFDEDGTDDTVT